MTGAFANQDPKLVAFNISQQRADLALTEFAVQSDNTIVFSFDLTKNFTANALRGEFSIKQGIDQLLTGSGLVAAISDSGRLSIHLNENKGKKSMPNKTLLAAVAAVLLSGATVETIAAEGEIEELTVIGSRAPGRSAEDRPVPVDVLTSEALEETGQTEVGRMLQALAPSFNFSSSAISDGTDALRPATLRGLGPDQTLVLVNGKRRHQASLIHVNTSVGRGTAGTDLNAIPGASIKRIEVLRDGAAAQYGSDAIAGVINLVLNDFAEGGKISVSTGETSDGDGETTNVDLTKGFQLGSSGFMNVALNFRDRDPTNRAGLHGSCQFPPPGESNCPLNDAGQFVLTDPREATANRETFRIGDAESQQFAATINTSFEFGDGELYGFITYSTRDNQSAAFFRHHGNRGGNAPLADGDATILNGFLPKINTEIDDRSFSFGYRTEFDDGSTLDISYTDGENTIDYVTSDSLNSSFANAQRFSTTLTDAEIRASVPRSANAYGLELGLETINLDFTQSYGDLFVALGVELREDEYKIIAGEEYAYRDYDTSDVDGTNLFAENRSGGIQGFPGIAPASAVDESREVVSLYADFEYEATDSLVVSAAARYDDYDGFGDTVNFKVAGNWRVHDNFSLRSAYSTGFRAPSMQQLFFNNLSTQFVPDGTGGLVSVQVGTFRNDSTLARTVGIPELEEEKSENFSIGFIANLFDTVTVTVDYYAIDIEDRIVISKQLGAGLSDELDTALASAGAGGAQFFLNGADTETRGVDLVATWGGELFAGELDITLAANFTETDVTDLFTPIKTGLDSGDVFSTTDISIIEEWQPEDRISLSSTYRRGDWQVNLAFNRYGEYTITDGGRQTYGAEVLTDLRVVWDITEQIQVNIGGNNIFDVTPDKNEISNARTGTIVDANGNVIVSSPGVFTFSRRSAPFGFNGAYYYAGVSYSF